MGCAGYIQPIKTQKAPSTIFFAIVTTTSNDLMKPIHDRMPVIIHKDDYDTWLTGEVTDAKKLLKPFDSDQMEAWRVGNEVNSPRNNNKELMKSTQEAEAIR